MAPSYKEKQISLAMMESFPPTGNTWPLNEGEWLRALAALEQIGVAPYLMTGMPANKARALASKPHCDAARRLLLQNSQQVNGECHV